MRSRTWRTSLRVLLLALALTLVQMGPLASPAAADPPPAHLCLEWADTQRPAETQDIGGGIVLVYKCVRDIVFGFIWDIVDVRPGGGQKRAEYFSDSSPPYQVRVRSILGVGTGGGVGVAYVDYRHPNDDPLVRIVAARVIVRYQPTGSSTWYACHDTNWQGAPTPRSLWEVHVVQYTQPDCGTGYYQAKVAGRFYSTSLERLITTPWVLSGSGVYLVCTDPSCQ
jgi:hypothetical protein